jgi:hypothetical protein
MQLTEQHIIDQSDPRYETIDKAAFASKNLYPVYDPKRKDKPKFSGKRIKFKDRRTKIKALESLC